MVRFIWDGVLKDTKNSSDEEIVFRSMRRYLMSPSSTSTLRNIKDARLGSNDFPMSDDDVNEFNNFLQEILKKIEKELLKDFLEEEPDIYYKLTTKKLGNETIEDERITSILSDFTFGDLLNYRKLDRLTGLSVVTGDENIKVNDFDYDEFLKDYDSAYSYEEETLFKFELSESEKTKKEREESPFLTSRKFSLNDQNFKLRSIPPFNLIKDIKEEHIIEQTKNQPIYKSKISKTKLPPLTFNFPITIPEDIIQDMRQDAKSTVIFSYVDVKLNKNNKPYKIVPYDFKNPEDDKAKRVHTMSRVEAAKLLNQTENLPKLLRDSKVYKYGDKYIKIISDLQVINEAETNRDSLEPRTYVLPPEDRNKLVDKFVDLIKKIHKEYILDIQKDPFKIYTFSAIGSIKNKVTVSKDLMEITETASKNKNQKITVTEFKDGKYEEKELDLKQASNIQKEAFVNPNTGKKISLSKYQSLDDIDKKKYIPNFFFFEGELLFENNFKKPESSGKYRFADAPEDALYYLTKKEIVYSLKPNYVESYRANKDDIKESNYGITRYRGKKNKSGERPPLKIEGIEQAKKTPFVTPNMYNKKMTYVPTGEYLVSEDETFDEKEYKKFPVVISDKEYKKMDSVKRNYFKPIINFVEMSEKEKQNYLDKITSQTSEENLSRLKDVRGLGKETESRGRVTAMEELIDGNIQDIKDSFAKAKIIIEIELKEHGELIIEKFRRDRNKATEKIVYKLKSRLSNLRKTVGV